jgi:Region found in RelA / SpoT proteins
MTEALQFIAEPPASLGYWSQNPDGLGEWSAIMPVEKRYSPGEINKAGIVLSSPSATKTQLDQAIEVMDNWRMSHTFPLELARKTLESRVTKTSANPTIGTRLKREESIRAKLVREPLMKLSTMQDIGGCRVIVRNMKEVDDLIALYGHDPEIKITAYVANPRVSGYRGKHIIWRFKAKDEGRLLQQHANRASNSHRITALLGYRHRSVLYVHGSKSEVRPFPGQRRALGAFLCTNGQRDGSKRGRWACKGHAIE